MATPRNNVGHSVVFRRYNILGAIQYSLAVVRRMGTQSLCYLSHCEYVRSGNNQYISTRMGVRMYVCVYVCMYVCLYICMPMSVCVYVM